MNTTQARRGSGVYRGPSQQEIDAFEMPKCLQGQTIKWWRNGEEDGTQPQLAFVERATLRTIVVRLSDGTRLETVRHVNDPKLRLGNTQRENGAWDHSDVFVKQLEFEAAIEDRLDKLEAAITAMAATSSSTEKPSMITTNLKLKSLNERLEDVEKFMATLAPPPPQPQPQGDSAS